MKRVTLVKFSNQVINVGDLEDYFQLPSLHVNAVKMVLDTNEYIPAYCHVEDVPIHKVVEDGKEHYIAVENKVWEYMYYIENPVTAKAQEIKIKKLTESGEWWEKEAWRTAESYKKFREATFSASLLTRIMWVFTGFKA